MLLAVVVTVVLLSGGGKKTYTIVNPPPSQAGGLKLVTNPTPVDPSAVGFKNMQAIVNGRARNPVGALYRDDARGLAVTTEWGTGDLGDPANLVSRMRAHPPLAGQSNSFLQVKSAWKDLAATDEGPHGGKAACGDASISLGSVGALQSQLAFCAWQTEHTFVSLSAVTSPTQPLAPGELAKVMRRMRPDLEKTA